MNVYLNKIAGIDDAIVSMYMSKRTWTRELEDHIRSVCNQVLHHNGKLRTDIPESLEKSFEEYCEWVNKLTKWGTQHITMLKFIDLSFTVEGLHRGGQDDWDAHAKRFDNRIIRSSTRLATFDQEMSDWYKDKIVPTDMALSELNINLPDTIQHDGTTYVKTVNGYIREDLKDDKDAKRGLYMLSIPSNFIYKINLTEFAHVYKERNINGRANPEVKQCAEMSADQLEQFQPKFTRELLLEIKN